MYKIILFVLLTLLLATISATAHKDPKGDTINISGITVEIKIPARISSLDVKNQSEVIKQIQNSLKSELNDYTSEMQNNHFISDNVITEVNVETIIMDGKKALNITYGYTLKNNAMKLRTDDFGPGKYLVNESNALQVTLAVLKRNLHGQLAGYVTPFKEISITINGSADAVPVKKIIPYKGEFGDHLIRDCEFEGKSYKMIMTKTQGIKNNQSLAFLRSYAVRDYLNNYIFQQRYPKLTYHHSAMVKGQRGAQFRRVFIEIIVFNAFD